MRGIDVAYGHQQALFGLSLQIADGEVVTLLGRNGMGKTTTVRAIMGLAAIRGGEIALDGQRIDHLPSHRIARLGLGLVPEGRHIFPNLTTEENLVATARGGAAHGWALDDMYRLFPRLKERRNQMARFLSGGEQQMLAIARALLTNPRILLLDEATEGLAPLIRSEIWEVIETIKTGGTSILVIDKDLKALLKLASRHYIIEKGAIAWSGSSEALAADSSLRSRYIGV
ncbi:MAG TPA: ABC transporter ATP-binding protein [Arenicellales bacterium]|nr:ABC transporter ATP-binding protein [Arenicellales bacterium]